MLGPTLVITICIIIFEVAKQIGIIKKRITQIIRKTPTQ